MDDDAAFFGLVVEAGEPEEFEGLWPDHEPAWRAFAAVSGQWRTQALSSLGGAAMIWLGLDYTAARAGLEMAGIDITPDLWAEVRIIEAAAAEELNRRVG